MICILMFSRCCSCSLAGRDQKSPKCKSHLNSPSTKTIKNSLRTSQSSLHNSVTSIKFIHMFNSSLLIHLHPSIPPPGTCSTPLVQYVRQLWSPLASSDPNRSSWSPQLSNESNVWEKNHGLLRVGDVLVFFLFATSFWEMTMWTPKSSRIKGIGYLNHKSPRMTCA